MMNLASFAFVDTTMFLSTMTLKYGRHFSDNDQPRFLTAPPFHDCRNIVLRGPSDGDWGKDAEPVDYPLLAEWPIARNLLEGVEAQIRTHLGAENLQIGHALVRSIMPGGHLAWHCDDSDYGNAHLRFVLLVGPCAGGQWFSGGDMLAPGAGNLTYINHRVLHSMINLGPVPQISLVTDVRRPKLQ